MKKNRLISSLFVAAFSISVSHAQVYTTLNQNFDGLCAITPGDPAGWLHYNPLTGTDPAGAWHCTPDKGRPNSMGAPTPGMTCTGVWASTYHLDTSYLVTPRLDLSSYTTAFMYFDTKADSIVLGGRLEVVYTHDSAGGLPSFVYIDSLIISPPISTADSLGWVTHQVNLHAHVTSMATPFYVAFRYTSPNTSGSAWYLDNVRITPFSLNVGHGNTDILPLAVLGTSTSSRITLSIGNQAPGYYQVSVYDMMGREVHREQANISSRAAEYTINGLYLASGLYVIKVSDGHTYGTVKTVVQ